MEELKQLIKEDKELLSAVDNDLKNLKEILADLQGIKKDFLHFFERQDTFMQAMQQYIGNR